MALVRQERLLLKFSLYPGPLFVHGWLFETDGYSVIFGMGPQTFYRNEPAIACTFYSGRGGVRSTMQCSINLSYLI